MSKAMTDEPKTVTAIKAMQRDQHLRRAFHYLLHNLTPWVKAYPIKDDAMPDHDIVWLAGIGGDGPEAVVKRAMEQHPSLWAHALPEGFVVVSRERLEKVCGVQPAIVDYLVGEAANVIGSRAAMLEQQEIEAKYERRRRGYSMD